MSVVNFNLISILKKELHNAQKEFDAACQGPYSAPVRDSLRKIKNIKRRLEYVKAVN